MSPGPGHPPIRAVRENEPNRRFTGVIEKCILISIMTQVLSEQLRKKLDVIANVAIIFAAIVLAIVLIRQQITRRAVDKQVTSSEELQSALNPGQKIQPPIGYDWGQHNRTLLIALRYGCSHCEKNMPFYGRVKDRVEKAGMSTSLLSIFPDDSFVAQHDLDTHGLNGLPYLANVNFARLHVLGTPTLILIDNKGTIIRSWLGELSEHDQDEVIGALR